MIGDLISTFIGNKKAAKVSLASAGRVSEVRGEHPEVALGPIGTKTHKSGSLNTELMASVKTTALIFWCWKFWYFVQNMSKDKCPKDTIMMGFKIRSTSGTSADSDLSCSAILNDIMKTKQLSDNFTDYYVSN